jgi:hypothetical protein
VEVVEKEDRVQNLPGKEMKEIKDEWKLWKAITM